MCVCVWKNELDAHARRKRSDGVRVYQSCACFSVTCYFWHKNWDAGKRPTLQHHTLYARLYMKMTEISQGGGGEERTLKKRLKKTIEVSFYIFLSLSSTNAQIYTYIKRVTIISELRRFKMIWYEQCLKMMISFNFCSNLFVMCYVCVYVYFRIISLAHTLAAYRYACVCVWLSLFPNNHLKFTIAICFIQQNWIFWPTIGNLNAP